MATQRTAHVQIHLLFPSFRRLAPRPASGVASAICRAPSPFLAPPLAFSVFLLFPRPLLPPPLLQSRGRCSRRRGLSLSLSPSPARSGLKNPSDSAGARLGSCPGWPLASLVVQLRIVIPAFFLLLFEVIQPVESPALFGTIQNL